MAEFSELFGSDEEILKEMRIADDIAKKCFTSSSKEHLNCEFSTHLFDSVSLESELAPVSVSDLSDDSGYSKISSFNKTSKNRSENSLQLEIESQILLENISALKVMHKLCIEKEEITKINNDGIMRSVMEDAEKVLSLKILDERLERINEMSIHMQTIAKQFGRIKQLIRNKPLKNSLKIHPACHKYVIQFFHLANELIESLEKDKACIEKWIENKNNKPMPTSKALHLRICELLTEIRIRIDNLIEFRKNVELVTSSNVESIEETETSQKEIADLKSISSSLSSMEIDKSITEYSSLLML